MRSATDRIRRLAPHLVLLLGCAVMLGPVLAVVMSGSHPSSTLAKEGLQLLPGDALAQNLSRALSVSGGISDQVTLARMMETSLVVAAGVAALTTALSLLTAYAIVFFRPAVGGAVLWLSLVTLMFPLEARFLPTFLVTHELGLVNTRLGIILPVLPLALGTLFLVQGLRQMPDELLEAAQLDGVRPMRFLRDFILPLMRARLGAVFAVSFIIGWNQYLWPLIATLDESGFTLVRGLALVGTQSGAGMVYVTLTLLPPLVLLAVFQRWVFGALRI